jgi:hypothetical protein
LLHSLEYGDVNWIAEAAKERGVTPPTFVQEKPELPSYWALYWEAYGDLTTTRKRYPVTVGFSTIILPGNISWEAVNRWAIRHKINDPDEFDTLWVIIKMMDSSYLNYHDEKQQQALKSKRDKRE